MDKCATDVSKYLSIHSLLKSISSNFISLFVPLIILQQIGYRFAMTYIVVLYFSLVISLMVLYRLIINKPMVAIGLHILFSITSYVLIAGFELNIFTIVLNAICSGISQALYTSPIFAIISSSDKKNDKMFSKYQIYSFVGTIVMILFNGLVLGANKEFSVWLTSLVSLIIYLLSLIPILKIRKNIKIDNPLTISFKQLLHKTKEFNLFHTMFGLQHLIVSVVVPLYLYINDLSLESIAYIVALVNVAKILVTLLANYLYKKDRAFISIFLGGVSFVIASLLLVQSTNNIFIYCLTIVLNLSFPLFFVPNCNQYGKKTKEFSYPAMVLRELLVHLFRPLLILPFVFVENLSILIYVSIVFTGILVVSGYSLFKRNSLQEG